MVVGDDWGWLHVLVKPKKEYAFQFRSNLIDTKLSEVINLDYYM